MGDEDPEQYIEEKINKAISNEIAKALSKAISYAIEEAFIDLINLNDEVDDVTPHEV